MRMMVGLSDAWQKYSFSLAVNHPGQFIWNCLQGDLVARSISSKMLKSDLKRNFDLVQLLNLGQGHMFSSPDRNSKLFE